MTTQYTTILKLALPVQGELSGTWGDVVNNNITQMVEQAIAGKATVNSWTANSHTLTTADGTTSESRCAILELTDSGTALTGPGTVVCPTNTKLYIVDNNTAQIVTVKTSGGTGIAVPVGKTMLVYCDGTNVVEGVTHANSLSLGTSTVTADKILDEDNMASDSATAIATQQSIKAYVDSQVGSFDTLAEVLAQGNTTGGTDIAVGTGDDITFADSSKAIFGADSDLQIYHDGSHARLREITGEFRIQTTSSGVNALVAKQNAAVEITYAGAKKLATTTTGIDVTGTVVADGLAVDSSGTAALFTNGDGLTQLGKILSDATYGFILEGKVNSNLTLKTKANGAGEGTYFLDTANNKRMFIEGTTGDISFYEDTGTTPKLTWDASAESLNFADNSKAIFGDGSDLQIYHDGSNSIIYEGGTGDLQLRGNGGSTTIMNGGGTEILANFGNNGAVTLYYDNAEKLATTDTGIDVTGVITTDGMTTSADINFGDNDKAIFGASSDLQIYHDGSNSYITDAGTGSLIIDGSSSTQIKGSSFVILRSSAGENMAVGNADGAFDLYYDGSKKLATSATGIDVTGSVTADGLTVDGASTGRVNLGTFNNATNAGGTEASISLQNNQAGCSVNLVADRTGPNFGSDFYIENADNIGALKKRLNVSEIGDISFYEDTGTTPKFFWDASAESLGIGTDSPSAFLHLAGTNVNIALEPTGTNAYFDNRKVGGATNFRVSNVSTNDTTAMTLTSAGSVGIGISSPQALIDLKDTTPTLRLTDGRNITWSGNETLGNIEFFSSDTSASGTHVTGFIKNINDRSGGSVQVAGALTFGVADYDTAASEAMRIDSSGNVKIGTATDRYSFLTASTANLQIDGGIVFEPGAGNNVEIFNYRATDMLFGNSGAEDMRLDASGNLLLGKSTTSLSTSGFELFSTGVQWITSSNTRPLLLNRTGTDGDIVDFRKAGLTVGSISTISSDLCIGSSTTRVRFDDNGAITPRDGSDANSDATIDLGQSNGRFKDLYLSGEAKVTSTGVDGTYAPILRGVYSNNTDETNTIETTVSSAAVNSGFKFNVSNGGGSSAQTEALRITRDGTYAPLGIKLGGTGAANKLDDYEEGTWTPVYACTSGAFTTMTMSTPDCFYTKVGRMVTVSGIIRTTDVDVTGASGSVLISGLPFAVASWSGISLGRVQGFAGDMPDSGWGGGNATNINLYYRSTANGATTALNVSDMQDGTVSNANYIFLQYTYQTS